MITININGRKIETEENKTILEVARENDIYIPTLCYLKKVGPLGTCRMCIVEIEGLKIPVAACTTKIKDGMSIKTDTEKLEYLRRENLKLLLLNHPLTVYSNESDGNELFQLAYKYGITPLDLIAYDVEPIEYKSSIHPSPILKYNPNRCILCGRCIAACTQISRIGALVFSGRGASTVVDAQKPTIFYSPECASCGECLSVCPTNAIEYIRPIENINLWELKNIETICPYCGVGCTIIYKSTKDKIISVEKFYEKGVNSGELCVKGRFGFDYVTHQDRLTKPLLKVDGEFKEISWDEAYNLIFMKFNEIKLRYGPDSIMGLSSAKCTNEENYLFQKFMRTAIGTNNVDHCARLCHSSTVAGLKEVLGAGAMTNSIDDMVEADLLFVIGSNTTENHPVIGNKIKRAVDKYGRKLIVADPRRIELTKFATLWMQHKPGTDIALLNGLAYIIHEEGLEDKKFIKKRTEGFKEYLKAIKRYNPDYVSKTTGVPKELLFKVARLIGEADNVAFIYAMGITQHRNGTDAVKAVANLALLTGNLGKPRAGVNPLRGQNNVQGACDMGCLPNVFPGYVNVNDPRGRRIFEIAWGTYDLPDEPGLKASELAEAIHEGKIKAVYIMGENPALTEANLKDFWEALEKLEFLVVQDIFLTETARYATLVLPAASSFEKDGTFTNTERRVQRVRKVIEPIGFSKPDWVILRDLLRKFRVKADYETPENIFNEIRAVVPQYRGITYSRLEVDGIQWPCPTEDHPGTMYLYKEGFKTPNGKAKFSPVEQPKYDEKGYEFTLVTGRSIYHFHTGSMTRRTYSLSTLAPEGYIVINPVDAAHYRLKEGDKIKIISRNNEEIDASVKISDEVPPKVLFSTFHFHEIPVNKLVDDKLDPVSGIPEYKVIPVNIKKIRR